MEEEGGFVLEGCGVETEEERCSFQAAELAQLTVVARLR